MARTPKVSIDLNCWGDHGWQWTETYRDGRVVECRTNGNGEGLWYRRPDYTWAQTRGTSQFWLPKNHDAAYKKIWKEAMDQIEARYGPGGDGYD